MTKRAASVAIAMWKVALAHRKKVLDGKGRLTGGGLATPVASAAELADELVVDNIVVHRHDGTEIVIYDDGPIPDLLVVDDGTTGVVTTVTLGTP